MEMDFVDEKNKRRAAEDEKQVQKIECQFILDKKVFSNFPTSGEDF